MNTARQSDAVTWWRMGRAAKAKGYDISKWAGDIKSIAARKLFLAGANGEPKPTTARRIAKAVNEIMNTYKLEIERDADGNWELRWPQDRSVYRVEWQGVDFLWHEVNTPGKDFPFLTRSLEQALALARVEHVKRGRPVRVENSLGGTIALLSGEAL